MTATDEERIITFELLTSITYESETATTVDQEVGTTIVGAVHTVPSFQF
jgi:hypothetical protein